MKFFQSLIVCATLLGNAAINASPLPVDESAIEPTPLFGRAVCKPLSKPKGRLFSIGGKTQYFAGEDCLEESPNHYSW